MILALGVLHEEIKGTVRLHSKLNNIAILLGRKIYRVKGKLILEHSLGLNNKGKNK